MSGVNSTLVLAVKMYTELSDEVDTDGEGAESRALVEACGADYDQLNDLLKNALIGDALHAATGITDEHIAFDIAIRDSKAMGRLIRALTYNAFVLGNLHGMLVGEVQRLRTLKQAGGIHSTQQRPRGRRGRPR